MTTGRGVVGEAPHEAGELRKLPANILSRRLRGAQSRATVVLGRLVRGLFLHKYIAPSTELLSSEKVCELRKPVTKLSIE